MGDLAPSQHIHSFGSFCCLRGPSFIRTIPDSLHRRLLEATHFAGTHHVLQLARMKWGRDRDNSCTSFYTTICERVAKNKKQFASFGCTIPVQFQRPSISYPHTQHC